MFNPDLLDLRSRPLPDFDALRVKKLGYREYPIDFHNPANREPLVDVSLYDIRAVNYYHREDNPPYYRSIPGSIPQVLLRQGVAERLFAVNERLRIGGVELFAHDGWRPQAIQKYMHDVWFPEYLRDLHPDWEEERVWKEVNDYWAVPALGPKDDIKAHPPHSTGAVGDWGLSYSKSGQLMYMHYIFDGVGERVQPDYLEKLALKGPLDMSQEEALRNARLLVWALVEAGFVINPTERWHGSYGDQMWANLNDQPTAIYSRTEPVA